MVDAGIVDMAPLAAVQQASDGDQIGVSMLRKALDNQAGLMTQLLAGLPDAKREGKGSLLDANA